MVDRYSGDRRGWAVVSPLAADRILVGVCAGIWLLLVGISVAAVVALVDLGRGFNTSTGGKHTPAVLYVIIVVSALVIVGAIPLLLHARRTTRANSASRSGMPARRVAGQPIRPGYKTPRPMTGEPATERLTTLGSAAGLSDAEVNRIWLRGTVGLLAAMGVALVAVATATYLMALGRYGLSWTGYGIAGAITATMPVIVWWHIRQARRMLAGSSVE
jgi:hypothetical protein